MKLERLRAWHPVLRNQLLAVAAGLLLFASFPPRPLWFLAPFGVALAVLTLHDGTSLRGGFWLGFLAGLGFFVPLLPWIGVYVGPVPWLALALASSVFIGLFGIATRLVANLPGWPIWTALAWSLVEYGRSNVPFGGFPWGRLAFGQAPGELLPLASIGGAPLLSFGVALTGAGLAALLLTRSLKAVAITALAPVVAAALWPVVLATDSGDREVTVAAIQGSVPRLGLDFNAQRRAVLDNHVRRTIQLADDVKTGKQPQPDFVLWPENSSDIDPLRNPDAAEQIDRAHRAIGVPIVVGAVLLNDDDTTTNSMIVWTDRAGERHDKRIVQPFGEYLPMRGFFRLFSSYADRAGYFVPGHGNGVLHPAGIPIGVATCWEVVFDRALHQSVRDGAQLIAVPTNNATFGDTEMTYQQLAMSRVRAVEHGRAVVVAATSGVSAIIAPDGSVQQKTPLFAPEALVAQLPLRSATTLATRLGPIPEILLSVGAACAIAAGLVQRRRLARTGGEDGNDRRAARDQRQDIGDHSDL